MACSGISERNSAGQYRLRAKLLAGDLTLSKYRSLTVRGSEG